MQSIRNDHFLAATRTDMVNMLCGNKKEKMQCSAVQCETAKNRVRRSSRKVEGVRKRLNRTSCTQRVFSQCELVSRLAKSLHLWGTDIEIATRIEVEIDGDNGDKGD